MKNLYKKILLFLIVMMMVVVPVYAEETIDDAVLLTTTAVSEYDENSSIADAQETLSFSKKIAGNAILAGNVANIDGNVDGILVGAGNSINVLGTSEYAIIAGNIITIKGTVLKDALVAGTAIDFTDSTNIGRDLYVAGSSVTLAGNVERNVIVSGSSIILSKVTIKGNAKIYSENITIGDDVVIEGTLTLSEDVNKTISDKATIGSIEYKKLDVDEVEISTGSIIIEKVVSYASKLLVFLVLALIAPKLFEKTGAKEFDFSNILSLCGDGLLLLVFAPVVSVLLMITVLGIPLGLILFVLYCVALYLSNIFAGYYFGKFIWDKFIKQKENMLLEALIGISIIFIVSFIPIIGVLVSLVSFLVGLGLIVITMKKK